MVGQGIRKQVKEIYKRGPGRGRNPNENMGWVSLGHTANKDPQDSPALFSDHLWLCVKQLSPNTEEEVRPSRFVEGAQFLFISFLFLVSLFRANLLGLPLSTLQPAL